MIYVVAGWPRSGTSMMMEALIAGGLQGVYDNKRQQACTDRFHDEAYKGNENYYEVHDDSKKENYPLYLEGKLIKSVLLEPLAFPEGDYKVIFMMRNPEEVRQSSQALSGLPTPPAERVVLQRNFVLNELRKRPDMDVYEVWYSTVLQDPVGVFKALGWPIDVHKAASVVNPSKQRYNYEELEIGA